MVHATVIRGAQSRSSSSPVISFPFFEIKKQVQRRRAWQLLLSSPFLPPILVLLTIKVRVLNENQIFSKFQLRKVVSVSVKHRTFLAPTL
ncbi:hypothetical protein H6P81_019887 [Aristolochia fimbriata]|uniref:Uncharacterized protein n=1 Tax=Aristolochia fimbriata TaxID=158543 RepID=A0AAV7DWW9_ARIFI|nr:hypothetical protein H6P81_019887 [Aristolochia fimbriata]